VVDIDHVEDSAKKLGYQDFNAIQSRSPTAEEHRTVDPWSGPILYASSRSWNPKRMRSFMKREPFPIEEKVDSIDGEGKGIGTMHTHVCCVGRDGL